MDDWQKRAEEARKAEEAKKTADMHAHADMQRRQAETNRINAEQLARQSKPFG